MKTAIILHGMPSEEEYRTLDGAEPAKQHWLQWLTEEFENAGIETHVPTFPEPYKPDYARWKDVFEKVPIAEDTILVGHSAGAGFIARWLSENKIHVGKVALVAPWLDPMPRTLKNGMFEFELDPGVQDRAESISIFVSADDDKDIHDSVSYLKTEWPKAAIVEFMSKGHFTLTDMGTREFPELRNVFL
ncbi:MAG: hypothetical protein JWN18_73 [Parcubacteria group bacterium]|nr:hypothetical protein [Parcubacteria group bacterium]